MTTLSIPLNGFNRHLITSIWYSKITTFNSIEWIQQLLRGTQDQAGTDATFNSIEWIRGISTTTGGWGGGGVFQFHWMDSAYPPSSPRLAPTVVFQFHWMDSGHLGPLGLSARGAFQFHWMDSINTSFITCYNVVPYLSIPLNGFIKKMIDIVTRKKEPFNSIEWIHTGRPITLLSTRWRLLSIPLNGFCGGKAFD